MLSIFLVSCTKSNHSKVHPNSENLPDPQKDHEHIVEENSDLSLNLEFSMDKYTLSGLIGEDKNIGFIKDVEVDKRGRVFLLDERQQRVLVYNSEGDFLQAVGRRGQGPGELTFAKSIALYQDSLLLISNRYRIEEYDIISDSISFNRTINFEINIKSICTDQEMLYVHNVDILSSGLMNSGNRKAKMLNKFTIPEYENQLTFGESYISDSPVIIDRLTQGEIICDPSNDMIVYVSDRVNNMKGYSLSSGKQVWKTSIAGLNFPIIEEIVADGKPGLQIAPPENGVFDRMLKPLLINDGIILLQIDRREINDQESLESNSSLLSYLIDIKTGRGQYYSDKLEKIIHLNGNRFLKINDAFTKLEIYKKEQ